MHAMRVKLSLFAAVALLVILPAGAQSAGIIRTVAGNGYQGQFGIGGPAKDAELFNPNSAAVDAEGNLFIADIVSEYIYRVDASTGKISIYAGTGAGGGAGDEEPATEATFNHPFGIAFGPGGNLFVTDSNNNVIRKINSKTGTIKTVAGNGYGAGPGDVDNCGTTVTGVKATKTPICNPFGLAVDSAGNLFFSSSSQVLEVSASTGLLTVVAGNGSYGYSGDGGPAVDAALSWIPGVAVDQQDNIYIADNGNCAIRMVKAQTGIITSLVGTPTSPWSGACGLAGDGGLAAEATISDPWSVTVDAKGSVFLADTGNNLVRVIDASNGNIYTVAGSSANGSGVYGYSGDGGPAVDATLADPQGIVMDSAGNLFIDDGQNFVVRRVTQPGDTIP